MPPMQSSEQRSGDKELEGNKRGRSRCYAARDAAPDGLR